MNMNADFAYQVGIASLVAGVTLASAGLALERYHSARFAKLTADLELAEPARYSQITHDFVNDRRLTVAQALMHPLQQLGVVLIAVSVVLFAIWPP